MSTTSRPSKLSSYRLHGPSPWHGGPDRRYGRQGGPALRKDQPAQSRCPSPLPPAAPRAPSPSPPTPWLSPVHECSPFMSPFILSSSTDVTAPPIPPTPPSPLPHFLSIELPGEASTPQFSARECCRRKMVEEPQCPPPQDCHCRALSLVSDSASSSSPPSSHGASPPQETEAFRGVGALFLDA